MAEAEVGDDVYGEDPLVNRLQEHVAELLGKERALFAPTGVMCNQLSLKVLTSPGDEVIVGESGHIFNYETGAPALLSGVQLHTVDDRGGSLDVDAIDRAIREEAYWLPRTSVIALEQTHNREGGKITPLERIDEISTLARQKGIALHLDGARLWNACAATGIPPAEYAAPFDTISVCLSKGLGAPVGSVMVGSARKIDLARHYRKIWGGGWRQAGILAAAGLYALEHNRERLVEDHANAAAFAERLTSSDVVDLYDTPETNIVIFTLPGLDPIAFAADLAREQNVLISGAFKGKLRAVFHMDVSREEALAAAEAIVGKAGERTTESGDRSQESE
jgi:threonine aldolase